MKNIKILQNRFYNTVLNSYIYILDSYCTGYHRHHRISGKSYKKTGEVSSQ